MNMIKRVEYDLKPHNVETIKRILGFYEQSNKCCAIQATGTGKTFLILRLLEIFNDDDKKAVVFAPNREIIRQTKRRMKKFGLDNAVFYTYQKLAKITDDEIKSINADLIVCDELHRTGAKTWGSKFEVLVETHPQSKVFGVTATPLRCADGRDMAEEYFDNNKACDISLAEALVREIIPVMPLYVSGLFTFEEEYENMREKIKKSNNSNEEKAELQEVLLAAKQQMEKAKGVPQIIKKYITNYNGKYIVFCKDKAHLYAMKDVVIGWFREAGYTGEIFEYPYYSNSGVVKKNLENFEAKKQDGLKLLFVIDKLNEGLHLDEIHGCILLRTTTSNIIYYQQIGRAIDAGSNEHRVILDLVSNFNSLKSFNFKKELENKVIERREGKFGECSEEFEIDKFDVVDLVQECIDVFNEVDDKINIKKNEPWTNNEIKILKDKYPLNGANIPELLHRGKSNIHRQAQRQGISFIGWDWGELEDNFLVQNYYKITTEEIASTLNKTYVQVKNRAKKLGLKRKTRRFTEEEIRYIRENVAIKGVKDCMEKLKTSDVSIYRVIERYDIDMPKQFKEWSPEEDKILRDNYPSMGKNVASLFPYLTVAQVTNRIAKLKLKSNSYEEAFYDRCRLIENIQKEGIVIRYNTMYEGVNLGRWAKHMKSRYNKGILPEYQVNRLKEICII